LNESIVDLLEEIRVLKDKLKLRFRVEQENLHCNIDGNRIDFEQHIKETHRQQKIGLFLWFRTSKFFNVISAPIIYSMILPIALLDLFLSIYQALCFRLYGIKRVKRSDYMIIDRQHLIYLNIVERFNCVYCGYANGVLSFAREILARSEQYWCPIKHAEKLIDPHDRYVDFISFGESENYHANLAEYRQALVKENEKTLKTMEVNKEGFPDK